MRNKCLLARVTEGINAIKVLSAQWYFYGLITQHVWRIFGKYISLSAVSQKMAIFESMFLWDVRGW
jgi:hypothetical protein